MNAKWITVVLPPCRLLQMLIVCMCGSICVCVCVYGGEGVSGEREPHPEAAVSLRKMVTFVTWPSSRTEFLV